MMECSDRFSASTTNRHSLVPTRKACILMQFYHPNRDGIGRLGDRAKHGARNPIDDPRIDTIIGIMLYR